MEEEKQGNQLEGKRSPQVKGASTSASLGEKTVAVALSAMLVIPSAPALSFADEPSSGRSGGAAVAQAVDGVVSASSDAEDGAQSASVHDLAACTVDKSEDLLERVKQMLAQESVVALSQDLTAIWSDEASITEAGLYRLSADVKTTKTLKVAAPEHGVVILDLAGFDALVQADEEGKVAESALVLDESKGSVVVVDSTKWDQAVEADQEGDQEEGPDSTISLQAPAADVVTASNLKEGGQSVVLVSASCNNDTAQAADDDRAVLLWDSVGIGSDQGEDKQSEDIRQKAKHYGIYAERKGVVLAGDFAYNATQDGGVALYGKKEAAFALLDTFKPADSLTVSTALGAEAYCFATVVGKKTPRYLDDITLQDVQEGITYTFDEKTYRFINRGNVLFSFGEGARGGAAAKVVDAAVASSPGIALQDEALEAPERVNVDLNAAWENVDDFYVITQAGTYYLSEDLTTNAALVVHLPDDAADKDVVINLGGHTFACTEYPMNNSRTDESADGSAIRLRSAGNVEIQGEDGTIDFQGMSLKRVVSSEDVTTCAVTNLTIKGKTRDTYRMLGSLQSAGFYASQGDIALSNVSINLDLSNQGYAFGQSGIATALGPSAVTLVDGIASARLSDCTLAVTNTAAASSATLSAVSTVGWAVGVYSPASKAVIVDGCTINLNCMFGKAAGVYGRNVFVQGGQTSVVANAGELAVGLYAASDPGAKMVVDAALAVSNTSPLPTAQTAGLYQKGKEGFVLKSGFSAQSLPVLMGDSLTKNNVGTCFALFDESVSETDKVRMSTLFTDGARTESPQEVVRFLDNNGLGFKNSDYVAVVTHLGVTRMYKTVDEAVSQVRSGDEIGLLNDVESLTIAASKGTASDSYTLDLNGHDIGALRCESPAQVTVTSKVDGAQIGNSSTVSSAVYYSGAGSLTLKNVDIVKNDYASISYGVQIAYHAAADPGTGTVTLDGVHLSMSSANGILYGVNQNVSKGVLSIKNSTISVSVSDESTKAAYGVVTRSEIDGADVITNSSISVKGTSSSSYCLWLAQGSVAVNNSSLDIQVTGKPTRVAGIFTSRANTVANLNGVAISASASDPTDVSCWCLMANTNINTVWKLAGACSFASNTNTHFNVYGGRADDLRPLDFAANFRLSGGDSLLTVNTGQLKNHAFASYKCASTLLEDSLLPLSTGGYSGWNLDLSGGVASWSQTAFARNTTTGATYSSLDAACNQAESGQVIELMSDVVINVPVSIANGAIIDLAGHRVTVKGTASGDIQGAFSVKNGAQVTVRDGKGEGQLDVHVGTQEKTAATYAGFVVQEGANLQFDSVAAQVNYGGATRESSYPEITLYGVYAESGSVSFADSSLEVVGAPEDYGFGALNATGVYAAKDATLISVDKTSRVLVNGNAQYSKGGYFSYPNAANTTYSQSTGSLIEIHPSKDSALYQEVARQFLLQASLDNAADASSGSEEQYVYGYNVYHAEGMVIDDGLRVWVCSDPVEQDQIGLISHITPDHIYVSVDYDKALTSEGIAAADDFAGTVILSGAINVSSTLGYAYGVSEAGENATWQYSQQDENISASVRQESYFTYGGKFDMADDISITKADSTTRFTYPKNSATLERVNAVCSVAQAIKHKGEKDAVAASDWEQCEDPYGFLYAPKDDAVKVTFTGQRNTDGSLAQDVVFDATYNGTLEEKGLTVPVGADYWEGTIRYCFVGWTIQKKPLSGSYAYQSQTVASLTLDQDVAAEAGSVTFSARYVAIDQDEYLVTYLVDGAVAAQGCKAGSTPLFSEAYGVAAMSIPAKINTSYTYSFPFVGWEDSKGQVYGGILPTVTEDTTYTAQFEKMVTLKSVSLSYKIINNGNLISYASTVKSYDYSEPILERAAELFANSLPSADKKLTFGGNTYTFLGWSKRSSDREAVLSNDELDDYISPENGNRDGYVLYGVYSVAASTVDVTFYVEGEEYAQTKAADADASIAAVKPKDPSRKGYVFKGWHVNENAVSGLKENVNKIGNLSKGESSLSLYAIWQAEDAPVATLPTVTFKDSDGTTLIQYSNVPTGTTLWSYVFEVPDVPKGEKHDLFLGWYDANGELFSATETLIWGNLTLYAKYRTLTEGNTTDKVDSSGLDQGTKLTLNTNKENLTLSSIGEGGLVARTAEEVTLEARTAQTPESNAAAVSSTLEENSDINVQALAEGVSTESTELAGSGATGAVGVAALAVLLAAGVTGLFRWLLSRRKDTADVDDEDEIVVPQKESIEF